MINNLSLRDPDGFLIEYNGRLFRLVLKEKAQQLLEFLKTPPVQTAIEKGEIVPSLRLCEDENDDILIHLSTYIEGPGNKSDVTILEHERIPFISYPSEWPVEMLHCAAELTIKLAVIFLDGHMSIKDATPYNILFRGPDPVFVDILSFEKRNPLDPLWRPYGQFMRMFVLPLLADQRLGLPSHKMLSFRHDGLEPEDILQLIGPLKRFQPTYFNRVTLPAWFAKSGKATDPKSYKSAIANCSNKADFILRSHFKRLQRDLDVFAPMTKRSSHWSDYDKVNSYDLDDTAVKESFVRDALSAIQAKNVLDIGCNTGNYSKIAAQSGASVIAIDTDPVVVGRLWSTARENRLSVLPLVVDFSNPTPAMGWRNKEQLSFLERATGAFDSVLMLAVLHHLLVSAQIPLKEIIRLVAEITTNQLIIEYIPPDDPMFRRISRGRDHLFARYTVDYFEQVCGIHFDIIAKHSFSRNGRKLYSMRKKNA